MRLAERHNSIAEFVFLAALCSLPCIVQAREPLIHRLIERGAQQEAREEIEQRISRKREPNQKNDADLTTIHVAARYGDLGSLSLLTEHGVPVDLRDGTGRSPLIIAAGNGHLDAVRLLLSQGASIGLADRLGVTAVMHAAGAGQADVVEALLAAGADIRDRDSFGADALMYAADSRQAGADVHDLLLDGGAAANTVDVFGFTAMFLARSSGRADLVGKLRERGVDFEFADNAYERRQLVHGGFVLGIQLEAPDGRCEDPRFAVKRFLILSARVRYPAWTDAADCQQALIDGDVDCEFVPACLSRSVDEAFQRTARARDAAMLAADVRKVAAGARANELAIVYLDPAQLPAFEMQFPDAPVDPGATTLVAPGPVELIVRWTAVLAEPAGLTTWTPTSAPVSLPMQAPALSRVSVQPVRLSRPLLLSHSLEFEALPGRAYKVFARFYLEGPAESAMYDVWVVDFESAEIAFESRGNPAG